MVLLATALNSRSGLLLTVTAANAVWRYKHRTFWAIYDLSQKWTGLVLHVAGGEYNGLLLALHERLQTDVDDSRI